MISGYLFVTSLAYQTYLYAGINTTNTDNRRGGFGRVFCVCGLKDNESHEKGTGRFRKFVHTGRTYNADLSLMEDFNPVIDWVSDHCLCGWECYPVTNGQEQAVLRFSFEDDQEAVLFKMTFC